MAQIGTTTSSTPFTEPGTNRIITGNTPGTVLWVVVVNAAATGIEFWKSVNSGANWTLRGTLSPGVTVQEVSGATSSSAGLVFAFRTNEASQDRIYIRRAYDNDGVGAMTFSAVSGSLIYSAANGGVAGAAMAGLSDCVSYLPSSGYHWVIVAVGIYSGSLHGARIMATRISPAGVYANNSSQWIYSNKTWLGVGTGRVTPYLAIGASQLLYLAWGRTYTSAVRIGWNGNGWSGPATTTEISGTGPAVDSTAAVLGSTWFHVAVPDPTTNSQVRLVERTLAWSTQTIRTPSQTHPTGNIRTLTMAWNSTTQDVRIYAIGTSTQVLYFCDFVRATGTWTAWAQVTATAILGAGGDNFSARAVTTGVGQYDLVYAHAGSPNTMQHNRQSVSYPPNTPTWVFGTTATTSPSNGSPMDVNAVLDLDWQFSDPDPADVQTAYALSRQIGAGALAYFRASDSTWQATEQKNLTATTTRQLAASWAAGSDADYSYRVKTWDGADIASGYSATQIVRPSVKVNPTITSPTDGSTITTASVIATWTVSEQTSYRASLYVSGTSELLYDSGWIANTGTRMFAFPTVLPDGFHGDVVVQTTNLEGLPSTAVTHDFFVDYVEPATPTIAATPTPASGVIAVTITNPAPGGGQPVVSTNDLYRRRVLAANLIATGDLEASGTGWSAFAGSFTRSSTQAHGGTWSARFAPSPLLNANPSFTTDASNWTLVAGTSFVRSTAQFHDSPASGLLTPTGAASTAEVMNELVAAFPYHSYSAAAWVRCASARDVNIAIAWYDAGSVLMYRETVTTAVAATTWTLVSASGICPPGASQCRMFITMTGTPPAGHTLHVDECFVRPLDGYVRTDLVPVSQFRRYFVDGWVRLDTANKQPQLRVHWYDATGTNVLGIDSLGGSQQTALTWLYLSDTVTAPAGAVLARVGVGVTGTPATGDALYADDVTMRLWNDENAALRIATGLGEDGTWGDYTARSGVAYEYQAEAIGSNGAVVRSAWTA